MPHLAKLACLLILLLVAAPAVAQEKEHKDRAKMIKEMMNKPDGAPKVGDKAPLFKLKSLDGKTETELKAFKDKKPVVLIFGSYT